MKCVLWFYGTAALGAKLPAGVHYTRVLALDEQSNPYTLYLRAVIIDSSPEEYFGMDRRAEFEIEGESLLNCNPVRV